MSELNKSSILFEVERINNLIKQYEEKLIKKETEISNFQELITANLSFKQIFNRKDIEKLIIKEFFSSKISFINLYIYILLHILINIVTIFFIIYILYNLNSNIRIKCVTI